MDYICDFCSQVVDGEADVCPNCGLEFSNTRCPTCGLTGSTRMFKNGCPNCNKLNKGKSKGTKGMKKGYSHNSNSWGDKIKNMSSMYKLVFLIVVINIALIWYITYVELSK